MRWLARYGNLLGVLIVSLLTVQCGNKSDGTGSQSGGMMSRMGNMFAAGAIPVKVDTVKIEPISTYILTNTTLEALREVDIVSRVSGIVQSFHFEEGDMVKKGDIIVKLDDRELRFNMEQAKAKLENTRRLFERSKEMFEKNLVSKETYDDALYQFETAKAQYENAVLQLEYASIRAPLDGVITKRLIEIGNYVNTNQVVYTMADFDVLLAKIYVPEKDIGKIKPGQKARIEVEAFQGKSFDARVKMINPVIDPVSGTVKVTVEVARKDTGLLPGMFASVYILTDVHPNALVIPKKSLILESETDRVFVLENGRAYLRDIKVGFSEGDKIEVLNGLKPGDLVVTVGQEGLRDGALVRVIGEPTGTEKPVVARNTASGPSSAQQSGNIDLERLKRMEERLLQNPEIRKEFEKRAKEDPDFAKNPEKKMAFFREMFAKVGR